MSGVPCVAVCVWLTIITTTVRSEDNNIVMTWYTHTGDRDATVQFTELTFTQFITCLHTHRIESCTIFILPDDSISSVHPIFNPDSETSVTDPSDFMCEQLSIPALVISCTRLALTSCEDGGSCWSISCIKFYHEQCESMPLRLIWNSAQQIQMTHNNSSVTISTCSFLCSSVSDSDGIQTLSGEAKFTPTQISEGITAMDSSCPEPCHTEASISLESPTTPSNVTSSGAEDDDHEAAAVAGIIFGGVMFFVLGAVGIIFWYRGPKTFEDEKSGIDKVSSQSVEMANGGYNDITVSEANGKNAREYVIDENSEALYATASLDKIVISPEPLVTYL